MRKILPPLLLGLLLLGTWEAAVDVFAIPSYLLPGPVIVARTLVTDWQTLAQSWWITMSIALLSPT